MWRFRGAFSSIFLDDEYENPTVLDLVQHHGKVLDMHVTDHVFVEGIHEYNDEERII